MSSVVRRNRLISISEVYRGARLRESYYAVCTKIRLVEASPTCG